MKTIGLIGGMSWQSSVGYYREINEGVRQKLGGLHSAKILLYSVDFEPIEKLQHRGDWAATGKILGEAAARLERGGADFFLICTNTMHKVAEQVQDMVHIPLLHIADATAESLKRDQVNKIGLLGTSFTMEQDFYRGRLIDKHGIDVIAPNAEDREMVHNIIYKELCLGQIKSESKVEYLRVVKDLTKKGCQGVILGCTEIGMLINQADTDTPLYDTTRIHAAKAVEMAL